ncbi:MULTISPECIES: hypothetical protein [Novosphingobium]|uniref:hypothetical protein n=1 Tax=Novosphingobium TaxID=165696 RepID=UPI001CD413BA|nr:hypothetical protein [Novosphingobium percolationis]MCH7629820.1 hypothetical protein [Pseudomonadota bacterium]
MADKDLVLLDTGLTRAAEALGDITPRVMQRLLARFPEAAQRFDSLCSWDRTPEVRARLEGEMVEQALYCLMRWLESPQEVEIILYGSVPHHAETLDVPPAMFTGLLEAVCDEIIATIPADVGDELQLWQSLRADLVALIARAALN